MYQDGQVIVYGAWSDGLRPDPDIRIGDWAEQHRVVSPKSGSPRPGKWSNDTAPYLREVMDCLSPSHPCRKVVAKKGAQLAFSEAGVNTFGFLAHMAPSPMAILLPTDGEVKKYNNFKLDPTISDTPVLAARVAEMKDKSGEGSTARIKKFPGGYALLTYASSSTGLQMISARYLIYEECSEYPADAGGRGHPIDQARTRSDAWADTRKEYFCSTPGKKGSCRITEEYEQTNQLRLYLECPHCRWYTTLDFTRFRWDQDRAPYHGHCLCAHCGERIESHHKRAMLARYAWIPTADADGVVYDDGLSPEDAAALRFDPWSVQGMQLDAIGFAASQLYSPFKGFDDIAKQIIDAERDPKKAKTVCQQVRGEPYDEGGVAPPWQDLKARREDYRPGTLPLGAVMLVAGGDVQGDRIEIEVVALGPLMEAWSVDYRVFEGNTSQPQVWLDLDEWFSATYPDHRGRRWPIEMLAIDNGYQTKMVNLWVARHAGRAMIIKGDGLPRAPYVRKGQKAMVTVSGRKTGIYQWLAGTYLLKRDFYDSLALSIGDDGRIPTGYCHWPLNYTTRACEDAHFKQVVAERLVEHKDGSKTWDLPPGTRNEALDTRVYAYAAAYRLGLPYWSVEQWRELAVSRGLIGDPADDAGDLPLFQPTPPRPAANGVRGDDEGDNAAPPPCEPLRSIGSLLASLNR